MRKYYYSTGVDRKGPVTLEELKSSGELTPETLVWYEGLPTWIRAADLPELSEFVNAAAPPVGSVTSAPEATLQRLERSMFLQVFSFTGRIRRLEYILSVMIAVSAFWLMSVIFMLFTGYNFLSGGFLHITGSAAVLLIIILFITIFLLAQGAKRSHDIGLSGWWQLMPLYDIVLIFFAGTKGPNRDGPDPRLLSSSPPLPSLAPNFRLEAIRNLKSSGKSFDEYDIELEIEEVKALYFKEEEERKRAIEEEERKRAFEEEERKRAIEIEKLRIRQSESDIQSNDRESSGELLRDSTATEPSSHSSEQQKSTRRKIIIMLVIIVVTLTILTIILYATGYFASLSQEPESWERYL